MSLFTGATALATALGGGALKLLGADKQAGAAESAAQLQAQAAQNALDFAKQKQAQAEQQAAPYLQLGQQAVAQLPSIARQAPSYGPPTPYTTQPAATRPMTGAYPTSLTGMAQPMRISGQPVIAAGPAGAQPMGGMGGGGTVVMQAPDGSQQAVPASQVQLWLSRGATLVGGGGGPRPQTELM